MEFILQWGGCDIDNKQEKQAKYTVCQTVIKSAKEEKNNPGKGIVKCQVEG